MSHCDIEFDWTVLANGAWFVWMTVHATNQPAEEITKDQKGDLSAEIAQLAKQPLKDLRTVWCAEFRKDHGNLSRDLLLRTLVWRLQEKAFGGHDRATSKLLDAYASGREMDPIFRRLKSGTVLIREYRGARHTVFF